MKKNILLIVLALLCVASVAFGFVQKASADEARLVAIENQLKAAENENAAKMQRDMAERAMHEAETQRQLANEALANCQKSKR